MTRTKLIAACLVGSGLASCAAPSTRIATALERYGLDAPRSECVGNSLSDHLSIGQLQSLGRAASAYRKGDTTPGVLTMSDLIRVAGEINDPKIPLEVARAGVTCGAMSSAPAPTIPEG